MLIIEEVLRITLIASGTLGHGETKDFEVELRSGIKYSIYVNPIESYADFDLYIYDETGNLIEYDSSTDSDAYCFVIPKYTGPFKLLIKSESGFSKYFVRVVQERKLDY
jgi:hypothetical protein